MALPLKKIEAEALGLSARERAELAHRLLVSLDEGATECAAEVEHAWAQEIQRRVAEVDAGAVRMIPAEQVFARLRRRRRA